MLDLDKRLKHLSACGQYRDAKVLKKQMKELKLDEKQKAMEIARQKLLSKSQALIQKHQKEIEGIKKKH